MPTRVLMAVGMGASPGAAVGKAVFDSATAVEWAARGEDVILVRRETNPDDLGGMVAARGILTSRGGCRRWRPEHAPRSGDRCGSAARTSRRQAVLRRRQDLRAG
ncbi:MAG: PEP-utilizing enzyme [Kineosporiaceae bacterium]